MEIFHKPFDASIALSPEDVLKRIEVLKGTYTKVQHKQDEDSFLVEIEHSTFVTVSSLHFRIWKPDENMRLSQISGVASARLDWSAFVIVGCLMFLMVSCACGIFVLFPPQNRFIGYENFNGQLQAQFENMNRSSTAFYGIIGLMLASGLLIVILEILFATFARNKYIKAVLALFDAELVREKQKREKLKH